jgi:hypothetical protein
MRNATVRVTNERKLWLCRFIENEQDDLLQAKTWISQCLPCMFSSDLSVHRHLQESEGDFIFGKPLPPRSISVISELANLSSYCKTLIAEWLRQNVFEFIVHAQTYAIVFSR